VISAMLRNSGSTCRLSTISRSPCAMLAGLWSARFRLPRDRALARCPWQTSSLLASGSRIMPGATCRLESDLGIAAVLRWGAQICVGWQTGCCIAEPYVSVRPDSPFLLQTVNCPLFAKQDGSEHYLVWAREKPANGGH